MSYLSSLDKKSSFNYILPIYDKNKNKSWNEWLEFDTLFDKPGKQGYVGLFSLKNKNKKNKKVVFKISQNINYLIYHESIIMKGLNDLSPYCPHFCKMFGTILCDVEPRIRKEEQNNPFNINSKYPIKKEVLLTEYISDSYKLYNYIRASEDKISEKILYSLIKQVLLAIAIAQKKKKFTHYDLHSFNIMIKRCDPDTVFIYVLDEENQFAVPTYGHYPIIIDFGFSYISDMDDGPLWSSMAHTDVGFMSDRFDWVADPKLFLVTISGEIKEKRKTKESHKLRRIVRNIFHPLTIDWDSGWDTENELGASDYVTNFLENYNKCSTIFEDYEHFCIDILQSLVILPLESQDYSQIHKAYETFVQEFYKIESQISSSYYNLYILKGIVDSARYIRAAYMCKDTRKDSLQTFKRRINDRVNEVAKFCKTDKIHIEKMLCSLLLLGRCTEGLLYDVVTTRVNEKQKEYNKLPLQSIEEIYGAIEANIETEYEFNEKTKIMIFDSYNEHFSTYNLPPGYNEKINELHPITRGTWIYDLYRSN